ncbi:unnamed protein product, partial [Acidithrix sp. C25]
VTHKAKKRQARYFGHNTREKRSSILLGARFRGVLPGQNRQKQMVDATP